VDVCPKCQRTSPEAGDFCPHCAPAIDEFQRETSVAAPVPQGEAPAGLSGLARRDVILMAAAVIGSGAITLAALSSGGNAPGSAPATPTTTVATAADPSITEVAAPSPGWVQNGKVWMGNARRGTALELAARNETSVWMRTVRPLLVVRCVNRRTDVFVFTDSAAAMEAQDEDHTVRLRFDDGTERIERWPDSSAHDALFAPQGSRLLGELKRARTLSFGYTPHNAAPVVAHFDLAGLSGRLGSAARHCQP
jgi:hypothetical protein